MSAEPRELCGKRYPDPPSGPCVLRKGHRKDLHKDADDRWWSDRQAARSVAELAEKVMSE